MATSSGKTFGGLLLQLKITPKYLYSLLSDGRTKTFLTLIGHIETLGPCKGWWLHSHKRPGRFFLLFCLHFSQNLTSPVGAGVPHLCPTISNESKCLAKVGQENQRCPQRNKIPQGIIRLFSSGENVTNFPDKTAITAASMLISLGESRLSHFLFISFFPHEGFHRNLRWFCFDAHL